jgi:murein DD-endopeptidase MepM/ murein hydrolase activator NlpD
MKNVLLLMSLLTIQISATSQAFLSNPIDANEIEDYTIVNYVDWSFEGFLDHMCDSKSYDGHQGTDFTLRSFQQMDEGVNVLAAADGVVTYLIDSLFDREMVSDVSKELGNYIAIKHENDYYTYYAHLKTNSVTVEVGDSVSAGDVIGQVGSSGNSTDPHLHFELWYDSLYVVDPFDGACGNVDNLWLNDFIYESDFRVWQSGLAENVVELNQLREREKLVQCCPFNLTQTNTKPTSYWAQLIGLREGDALGIKWYTPASDLWFEFDIDIDQDYWYYYYWSFIDPGELMDGEWTVELYLNNDLVDQLVFNVTSASSTHDVYTSDCENISPEYIDYKQSFDISGRAFLLDSPNVKHGHPYIEKVFLKDGHVCKELKIKLY